MMSNAPNNSIGSKCCWVCGSELPLEKIPSGCNLKCAKELREYGTVAGNKGEPAWLCGTHYIVWFNRQRLACLEELKVEAGE